MGGWVVIEDIEPRAVPLWEVVGGLLAGKFQCHLLGDEDNVVFAAKRLL